MGATKLTLLLFMLLQTDITVHWAGWKDELAGIKGYELEINKLQPYGDTLAHSTTALVRKSLSANNDSFNISLVDPGENHDCSLWLCYM